MVRLTDRPNMTLDVYGGRKTTMQKQQPSPYKKFHFTGHYVGTFDVAWHVK